MPVYDFKCPKCDATRTETISISESEFLPMCKCGERMLKVYKIAGVAFKGNGFYRTDKKD